MPAATFDGPNLIIKLPSVEDYDAGKDLYSRWKDWVAESDNAKYPIAFETTGGDDIGGGQTIAPYFFCRNDKGWRIEMPNGNGEIVLSGNLFPRDASQSLFQQSPGFDAFLRQEVSSRSTVIGLPFVNLIPGLF